MKAAVDAHFGRQELQKQLVNVTNLASWKEFCTKFGDVLAETLDGIINACKVAKAKTLQPAFRSLPEAFFWPNLEVSHAREGRRHRTLP